MIKCIFKKEKCENRHIVGGARKRHRNLLRRYSGVAIFLDKLIRKESFVWYSFATIIQTKVINNNC
jgi:hypothetical protein